MAKGQIQRRGTASVASSSNRVAPDALTAAARPPVVVQIGAAPRKRRPRGTAHQADTSALPLLASQGGYDWIGSLHHASGFQRAPAPPVSSVTHDDSPAIDDNGVSDRLRVDSQDEQPLDMSLQVVEQIASDGIRPNRKKKEKQWRTWDTVTIPHLVRPYLRLLRLSNRFRDPLPEVIRCECTTGRNLQVLCVYLDSAY